MPARVRPRGRLYHQVRTAHLERAAQLPPATILFANRRYDFAPELAERLDLVQVHGRRAASWLLRNPVATLEVNEPLMLAGVRTTALALAGLAAGRLLGRPRTRVVSYAIENLDPAGTPAGGPKGRLARTLDLALARLVWRRLDRIAYGTEAACELYARALPPATVESTLIRALPAPAEGASADRKHPGSVLFLGAFTSRKGFEVLTAAWPQIRAGSPAARLRLIGKGPLQAQAEELAAADDRVDCLVDPPREVIRDALAEAQVLVLPSQPAARWREQVGLPIVEGLSYGCTIVTTTETGLADWLAEHGHRVVPADGDPARLAEAVLAALADPAPDVLATLPEQDGRLAADAWMFR